MKKYHSHDTGFVFDDIESLAHDFVVDLAREGEWHSVQYFATMFISGEWDGMDEATQAECLEDAGCNFTITDEPELDEKVS